MNLSDGYLGEPLAKVVVMDKELAILDILFKSDSLFVLRRDFVPNQVIISPLIAPLLTSPWISTSDKPLDSSKEFDFIGSKDCIGMPKDHSGVADVGIFSWWRLCEHCKIHLRAFQKIFPSCFFVEVWIPGIDEMNMGSSEVMNRLFSKSSFSHIVRAIQFVPSLLDN